MMRAGLFVKSFLAGLAGVLLFMAASFLNGPVRANAPDYLIFRAWEKTLGGEGEVRPWPWLASMPVARLIVPDFNEEFVILQGTSGDVLAFAPGWDEGTNYPGTPGITMISAHRNLHFGFLNKMKPGQLVLLQDTSGREHRYTVTELRVVQEAEIEVPVSQGYGTLLLSTSFPFSNWQQGENMRLVVVAVEKPLLTASDETARPSGA